MGYEEGGSLTEAVRRRPYSVVLLDEVEKAHPDVFNFFLQVFDDGRITDGQGRTVDFTNTLIIMTSNIGSQLILQESDSPKREEWLMQALRQQFRPEFLNRIDEIVTFNHLEKAQLRNIISQYASKLDSMLKERGLSLQISDEAMDLLCERGYDRDFGARPMKRVFQREIQNPLAVQILSGKYPTGSAVKVTVKDGGFSFG